MESKVDQHTKAWLSLPVFIVLVAAVPVSAHYSCPAHGTLGARPDSSDLGLLLAG